MTSTTDAIRSDGPEPVPPPPSTTAGTAPSAAGAPVLLSAQDARGPVRLTVVVPTRDEAETVPVLLERLGTVLGALPVEILFVDDSDDDTPGVLARHASHFPVPVRLTHRPKGARDGGLGGAVVAGARHAWGDWVMVMDADLQHPPEAAAAIARAALRHDADILIGTRYAGAGSGSGLDGAGRHVTSSTATRLAKAVFPVRLATVTDPMSGFFAFRTSSIDLAGLRPRGFKLLLEILVRNPTARVAEVAYEMAPRHAGRSKASMREGAVFLRALSELRVRRLYGQLRTGPADRRDQLRQVCRMLAFGTVGLSGIVVNTAALWLFFHGLGLHHILGAALATQVSTAWNFLLIDRLVYRRGARGTAGGRAVRFFAMNNLLLLARLPVLQVLVWSGAGVLTANAVTLVLLFLVRFLVSDRVIYGKARKEGGRDPVHLLVDAAVSATPGRSHSAARKRSFYLPYRYDVAGTVTIGSQIRLPELEFFRAQWVADDDVDIVVRVGDVGRRRPRRRAAMTEYPPSGNAAHGTAVQHAGTSGTATTLRYEEHLGRFGANFRIHLGEPITIEVGPLLARSPHVVYTNILEALLRFVLVSRGRMLLHSACISLDGVGVMLSALTDTGKTATILRLLREHGGRFLSDDMTVVGPDGDAVCFPKPLTISSHTLRAVQANDLTTREWRRLRFQSRLHSKGGRSIALTLSRFNLPIMGINAITQILVPPPKYTVDRIVPCRLGSSTTVEELFIIERGAPSLRDLEPPETLERMLTNTDDAYGFPPFRYLAPAITIGGLGYQELREREREILAAFLSRVRARALASDTFGWADEIPQLVRGERSPVSAATHAPAPARHRHGTVADVWPRWGTGLTGGALGVPVDAAGLAADGGTA